MQNRRYFRYAPGTILLPVIFFAHVISLNGQDTLQKTVSGGIAGDLQLAALHDMQNAQVWWYGWLAGYSAATAGQVIVAASTESLTTRQDMILGAGTTFLGALGQLIMPLGPREVISGYPSVKQYMSGKQPVSQEEAMELLEILAAREREGRSWKTHAIAGTVNLASGLITWLGFKRTVWDGVANFALNTAVTEAQIWTQPTRAIKDYERYLREYHPEAGLPPPEPESEWTVCVYPGGIALKLDF